MRLLLIGGADFIGSHSKRFLTITYIQYFIVCVDALIYAANHGLIVELETRSNTSYGDYLSQIVQSHGG